jgi:hypothetical protein
MAWTANESEKLYDRYSIDVLLGRHGNKACVNIFDERCDFNKKKQRDRDKHSTSGMGEIGNRGNLNLNNYHIGFWNCDIDNYHIGFLKMLPFESGTAI